METSARKVARVRATVNLQLEFLEKEDRFNDSPPAAPVRAGGAMSGPGRVLIKNLRVACILLVYLDKYLKEDRGARLRPRGLPFTR
jgi:hypothetical protein